MVRTGKNETNRRVLVITGELPPMIGGVGAYAVGIASALKSVGVEATVVTSVPRGPGSPPVDHVIWGPKRLNYKGLKLLPLMAQAVGTCLRRRPDHVICMTFKHEGLVGLGLRSMFTLPFSVVVHGTELNEAFRDKCRRKVAELVMRRASHVICNSSYTLG